MTVVIDASVVVASLIDPGRVGRWAAEVAQGDEVVAPHLLPAEVTSVLRRHVLKGHISAEVGALTISRLGILASTIEFHPFGPLQSRVWELRNSLTAYDAWYVATAEFLHLPLATLDQRLVRAHGPRCPFLTPPEG